MKDKVYFEFYRDFDKNPLSAGFYDSNILKTIKQNTKQSFYDPLNDKLETHIILARRIAYYKGNVIMVAVTLNTTPYIENLYFWSDEDIDKFNHYIHNCVCNAVENFKTEKEKKQ